jgi:hypothetical protein
LVMVVLLATIEIELGAGFGISSVPNGRVQLFAGIVDVFAGSSGILQWASK